MTVKELIERLEKENPDKIVSVWDPCYDCEDVEVKVSHLGDNVHIGTCSFGGE